MQVEARRQGLDSRLEARSFGFAQRPDSGARFGVRGRFGAEGPAYLHARYYDRPDLVRYSDRHISMYYDPYNRLHHRIIWPSYFYPIYYPFGPYGYCDYLWPYYHRKYVFISLGGWWPYDYDYLRYYWYGYHPYAWYGYYPIPYEMAAGGDNYYTYNYYGDNGNYTPYGPDAPLDPVTQARIRANWNSRGRPGRPRRRWPTPGSTKASRASKRATTPRLRTGSTKRSGFRRPT